MDYPPASCQVCGTEWEGVGAFCSDACRAAFAARMDAARLRYFMQPGSIWPGDTVRLKTAEEKLFERLEESM